MATEENSSMDPRDIAEKIDTKLTHLSAMLYMTYGGGFEPFNQLSDEVRDHYMWACSDLANECGRLFTDVHKSLKTAFRENQG